MRQLIGILLVLVSVFLVFQLQKKSQFSKQNVDPKEVSDDRVNQHLFITNEQINLQKEKIEVIHRSNAHQSGATYEVHQENTTGVDISTDQRPGKIVHELGREKKLDRIENPQNEIQNELMQLQAQERENEKKKIEEMKLSKARNQKKNQLPKNSK